MTGELYYSDGLEWYHYALLPDLTITLCQSNLRSGYTDWKWRRLGGNSSHWNNYEW